MLSYCSIGFSCGWLEGGNPIVIDIHGNFIRRVPFEDTSTRKIEKTESVKEKK
jgi:hypothetical protein